MIALIALVLMQAPMTEPAPDPAPAETVAPDPAALVAPDPAAAPATSLPGPVVDGEQSEGRAERANRRTCRATVSTGSRVSRGQTCMSDSDRRNHQDLATSIANSSRPPLSH